MDSQNGVWVYDGPSFLQINERNSDTGYDVDEPDIEDVKWRSQTDGLILYDAICIKYLERAEA